MSLQTTPNNCDRWIAVEILFAEYGERCSPTNPSTLRIIDVSTHKVENDDKFRIWWKRHNGIQHYIKAFKFKMEMNMPNMKIYTQLVPSIIPIHSNLCLSMPTISSLFPAKKSLDKSFNFFFIYTGIGLGNICHSLWFLQFRRRCHHSAEQQRDDETAVPAAFKSNNHTAQVTLAFHWLVLQLHHPDTIAAKQVSIFVSLVRSANPKSTLAKYYATFEEESKNWNVFDRSDKNRM